MASPNKRLTKPISKATITLSPADELINEMIQKRKLQQEALLKIMTSIDSKKKKNMKGAKISKTNPSKTQKSI
ncbi:MAG TPA: hypothetical protein DGG95_01910 [Cytophagales bacterium]|jgi:hypothetical protein|nr:hypothetical protein [Cytophagales bacterium]